MDSEFRKLFSIGVLVNGEAKKSWTLGLYTNICTRPSAITSLSLVQFSKSLPYILNKFMNSAVLRVSSLKLFTKRWDTKLKLLQVNELDKSNILWHWYDIQFAILKSKKRRNLWTRKSHSKRQFLWKSSFFAV